VRRSTSEVALQGNDHEIGEVACMRANNTCYHLRGRMAKSEVAYQLGEKTAVREREVAYVRASILATTVVGYLLPPW